VRTILTIIKSAFTSGRRPKSAASAQLTVSDARDQAVAAYYGAPPRRPF